MSENPYLSGNFAPVHEETTAFDLPVRGEIPRSLRGRFLRIGPNPLDPDPATHHWFIGSGLVHGLKLEDGEARWYRSRFVRDDDVVRLRGGDPVPGPAHDGPGSGAVNTNVVGLAGRTFAIVEAGGRPVELSYELDTLRRSDFDGSLAHGFTAHPKLDPATGEMHAAVYSAFDENIQYVVVGKDGRVRRSLDIHLPHKPMIHDCAITENHFLVLDLPCVFDGQALLDGIALPYRWHPELPSRVGVLPREGSARDLVWCEVDPCYVFHPMNAYEEADGRIVLDVVRHPKMFATDKLGPSEGPPVLERWRIDPKGGPVKTERIDDRAQEFPRIDERLVGRPYRFGYVAELGTDFAAPGLLKHDMRSGTAESHREGEHRTFLEPVFVPSHEGAGEDEGYVLAYVHDANRNASDVVILHAQDFSAPPIATIELPARVPYGFHGNWVADD